MESRGVSLCSSTEKSLKAETLRFADPTGVQNYIPLFQVSGFHCGQRAGPPEIADGFCLLKG